MATLDLTLAQLRLAGLTNFTPEFGTKEADGVSVSTENVCKDIMLPFTFQRPVLVNETSDTGNIEANRTLVLTNSNIILTLGRATFAGCKIVVQAGFTSGSAKVKYLTAANTYETVTLAAGNSVEIVSNSALYFYKRLRVNNSIVINTNERLINNRRYLYPSVFPLVNRNKETDFVVQNNALYSKNTVYIRAGTTLPPFYVEGVGILQWHTESDVELGGDDLDDTELNGFVGGKDYFIYLIYSPTLFPNAPDNLGFKISLNDPDGISLYGDSDIAGTGAHPLKPYAEVDGVVLTEENCLCIGGFHTVVCDCNALPTGAQIHPFTDYTAGAVHPFSVWDLFHRPEGTSVGMTYNPCVNKWGSIYLLSERAFDKTGTAASYGGTYPKNNIILISAANKEFVTGATSSVFPCLRGEQILSFQKQRFPTLQEFTAFTLGSPQGLAIKDAANPVTTGGHLASDNTQIISYCGMFDGVGVLCQWGQENGYTSTNTWSTNYNTTHDKDVKGDAYNALTRVVLGGYWGYSSHCGSRSYYWNHQPMDMYSYVGFRAVAEPRHPRG